MRARPSTIPIGVGIHVESCSMFVRSRVATAQSTTALTTLSKLEDGTAPPRLQYSADSRNKP